MYREAVIEIQQLIKLKNLTGEIENKIVDYMLYEAKFRKKSALWNSDFVSLFGISKSYASQFCKRMEKKDIFAKTHKRGRPAWYLKNIELKGLINFNTDGSVIKDKHQFNQKHFEETKQNGT